MNKREAKREAISFVVDLIESTMGMAPFCNDAEKDAVRIEAAIEELRDELARRCGRE